MVNAHKSSVPSKVYLANKDAFTSDDVQAVAQYMQDNIRSRKRIGDGLKRLFENAKTEADKSVDMFGDVPKISKDQLLKDIAKGDESNVVYKSDDVFTQGGTEVQYSKSAVKSVDANIRRGSEAMNKAIVEKTTVNRAMYRNDLGWVDFVWGDVGTVLPSNKTKGGMGITHIIEARMRKDDMRYSDVVKMLTTDVVETIAKGETVEVKTKGNSQTLEIVHNKHFAGLIKNKGSNAWVLTAFELRPDANVKGSQHNKPTHTYHTRFNDKVGAERLTSGSEQSVETDVNDTQVTDEQAGLGAESNKIIPQKIKGTTIADLENALQKLTGGKKLKNVEVVQSHSKQNIQGMYNPNTGKITLVADNIAPNKAVSVLLHEVWHRNENQLLTPQSLKQLREFVTKWQSASKDSLEYKVWQAANRRAKASGDYDGEFIAYAIEEAVSRGAGISNKLDNTAGGLLTRVRNLVQRAVAKYLPNYKKPLTANDLVAMARSAFVIDQQNNGYADSEHGGDGKRYSNAVRDIKKQAAEYARANFAGKTFKNKSDGMNIIVGNQGIKHAMSGNVSEISAAALAKLDAVLTDSEYIRSEPDRLNREEIKEVRFYQIPVTFKNQEKKLEVVVRVTNEGTRYYDYFEVRNPAKTGDFTIEPVAIGEALSLDDALIMLNNDGNVNGKKYSQPDNTGEFNPANDDIRYSKAEAKPEAEIKPETKAEYTARQQVNSANRITNIENQLGAMGIPVQKRPSGAIVTYHGRMAERLREFADKNVRNVFKNINTIREQTDKTVEEVQASKGW